MFQEILVILCLIGQVICDICSKYSSFGSYYYVYCSGYCGGSYGHQYCLYYYYYNYYVISGGTIAGISIGVLCGIGLFIVVVVICLKSQKRSHVGAVIGPRTNGTNVFVSNTSQATGYMQPPAPYGSQAPPPQYNQFYPPPQPGQSSYPPLQQGESAYPPPFQQGYGAPAQPQYRPVYNQPPNSMPD